MADLRDRAGAAGRALAATLLAVAIALAAAELVVRTARLTPRVQVVDLRLGGMRHEVRDGVVLWYWPSPDGSGPFRGGPCPEDAPTVALAGDSIFETIEVQHERERVADRLREGLRASGRADVCVLDGSWGGYQPVQQLAMLEWLAASHRVDVAVMDVWKVDRRLHAVGDRLYDSEAVRHEADGTPSPPLPLPGPLHRWLLPRSRLWEYATLALARPGDPDRDPAAAYLGASAWSREHGIALVLAEAPSLDRPLATSAAERAALPPDAPWERLRSAAEASGQRYVVLADALADADVERIRYDTCCHYLSAGHARVAEALLPHVLAALPPPTAPSASTAPPAPR